MLSMRWNQTGRTIILSETTDEPLTLAGYCAGAAWGADTSYHEKNFKRGLDCLHSGHGRVLEFPQIYMVLDGWSARVIREFGRHVGGLPTYV
jgi:thymidylate synthase (FAD)